MEKEQRTQMHQTIKEIFSKVTSTTINEGDKKYIKCLKLNKKSMNVYKRRKNKIEIISECFARR